VSALSKSVGGDRFEADNKTNLLEDMVYEKYDQTPTVSPEDGNVADGLDSKGGTDSPESLDPPGGAAPVTDPDAAPAIKVFGQGTSAKAPRSMARFSDRVKVNQALRVMTETLLGGKIQDREILSFFKISLDSYLSFLHSQGPETAVAVAAQIIRVLEANDMEVSRFEAVKDALRREQLWADAPRALWQERIASLMNALTERLELGKELD
jgi:hypothetical protein